MDSLESEKDEIYQYLEFQENQTSSTINTQPMVFSHNILNYKKSKILFKPFDDTYLISQKFSLHLDIPEIEDWRLNLLEINIKEKYLITASIKKIILIPFDFSKTIITNVNKKYKILIEAEEKINQIKIMKNIKEPSVYITAVDDKGYLHIKKINYDFYENQLHEQNYIRFNCCINSSDNSVWSLDCKYPYIIVGGNHKCAQIFNLEEEINKSINEINLLPIKKNFIYKGNKHNVPYVSFSPNGEFVSCASIDTEMKIWDTFSGRLITKINNKNNQWGWASKLIEKNNFSLKNTDEKYEFNFQNNSLQNFSVNICSFINSFLNIDISDNRADVNFEFLKNFQNNININHCQIKNKTINTEEVSNIQENVLDCQKKINPEKLYISYITNSLLKYLTLCSYKDCFYLNSLLYDEKEGKFEQINLGKINLVKNYLSCTLNESNLNSYTIFNLKYVIEYSRYEFLFTSYALNILIIGNRNGDIQIYPLEIKYYFKDYKIGISEQPISIIDFNGRIAGVRVLDYINESDSQMNYCEIYVLKIDRTLECYKLKKNI